LVARVHRGAPAIGERAARLHTRPRRHPGVSIAILNHIADSRLVLLNDGGRWPPFEKPAEWAAQVLAFLRGY
jgi:pimeloyl-ACP methyl ester carboxylesterase